MRLERNPSSISRVYSNNSQPSERRHIRLLPVRQGIGSELVFDRSMHGSTAKLAFDALDKSQTPDRDRMLLARLTTAIARSTYGVEGLKVEHLKRPLFRIENNCFIALLE